MLKSVQDWEYVTRKPEYISCSTGTPPETTAASAVCAYCHADDAPVCANGVQYANACLAICNKVRTDNSCFCTLCLIVLFLTFTVTFLVIEESIFSLKNMHTLVDLSALLYPLPLFW